jgi:hypothetical protein
VARLFAVLIEVVVSFAYGTGADAVVLQPLLNPRALLIWARGQLAPLRFKGVDMVRGVWTCIGTGSVRGARGECFPSELRRAALRR